MIVFCLFVQGGILICLPSVQSLRAFIHEINHTLLTHLGMQRQTIKTVASYNWVSKGSQLRITSAL